MDILTSLIANLLTQAAMVEARDTWAGGHLWRISQYARRLAEDLALPPAQVALITLGAAVHDLGKIGVAEAILNKPGLLSDDEFDNVRAHPDAGLALLAGHPLGHLVRDAVLLHHETPDGTGYPRGVKGEALPLTARVIGLVDAFDALTSTRAYRRQLDLDAALQVLEDHFGSQFDADIGARLVALARSGALNDIIGHSEAGVAIQTCGQCGPIIALPHKTISGTVVACPACRTAYKVLGNASDWHLRPLPLHISARPLSVDSDLIACMAREIRQHLDESMLVASVANDCPQ